MTWMLLPVHAPLPGLVMVTVGVAPPPPPLFATVTVVLAVAVCPRPSSTVAVSVCEPSATCVVSHGNDVVSASTVFEAGGPPSTEKVNVRLVQNPRDDCSATSTDPFTVEPL